MVYAPPAGSVTRRLRLRLLHLVLPAWCLGCASPVWETRGSLGLCPGCRRRLRRPPEKSCASCGRLLAGEVPAGYRCGRCRRRPPPFEALLTGWSYQPPLDAVVAGLKFGRLDYLGNQLGEALAGRLAPRFAASGPFDAVVPVPLHWSRRLKRGYNQAELIAGPLAQALGVPLRRWLRRRRATPPQTALPRPVRRRNVRGAFAVRRRAACRGRTLLLVDDVATTGATLREAAAALRRAGGAAVTAVAAGRTPEPGEQGAAHSLRAGDSETC